MPKVPKMELQLKRSVNVKICESEASETQYWLEVLVEAKWLSRDEIKPEYNECSELLALFTTIGKRQ